MNLKLKKTKTKKYVHTGIITSLEEREVELSTYGIGIDGSSIIIESIGGKGRIDEHYMEIAEYLGRAGFKEIKFTTSTLFRSPFGVDIYLGRKSTFHSVKILKISTRGSMGIYKGLKKAVRDLANGLAELLIDKDCLVRKKFTSLDISFLVHTNSIYNIIPNYEQYGIQNTSSSLEIMKWFQYKEDIHTPSGISMGNSDVRATIYDKDLEVTKKLTNKKCSLEYFNFYQSFIREGENKGKRTFRYELRTIGADRLMEFTKLFFDEPENIDRAMLDIMIKFSRSHDFRKPPLGANGETLDLNRQNMNRWEKDAILPFLLTGENKNESECILSLERKKAKNKYGLNIFKFQPTKNKTLFEETKRYAKAIAQIHQTLTTHEKKSFMNTFWLEYNQARLNQQKSLYNNILNQQKFMLYHANSNKEVELINERFQDEIRNHKLENKIFLKDTFNLEEGSKQTLLNSENPVFEDNELLSFYD